MTVPFITRRSYQRGVKRSNKESDECNDLEKNERGIRERRELETCEIL